MINKIWIIVVTVCVLTLSVVAEPQTPQALKAERPSEWWYQRHKKKITEAQEGDVDILLIGDSITHYGERQPLYGYYFGNRKVMNLGFGGDGTQHVLWRLNNGEIDGLTPKVIFIMIGTNNTRRNTPEEIFLGIEAIVNNLRERLPETKIVLFSIFPRNVGSAYEKVKAVNEKLPALAGDDHVTHVDINEFFLNPDDSLNAELYYKDLLHLSDKGYALWYSKMEPFISQALGDEPRQANPPRAVWSSPRDGPRHREKLIEAAQSGYELVFVGDSITHFWEREGNWGIPVWEKYYGHRKALNLGFGGDTTDWVNWRLQNGEVEGLSPKLVVLMIGTNNTHVHKDPPEDTLAGIESNLQTIRHQLPESQVLLLSIFPRGETPEDPLRQINEQINRALPELADRYPEVHHMNINDAFLDEQGTLSREIMPDLIHPNTRGYEIWAEAMEPTLSRLLRDTPVE